MGQPKVQVDLGALRDSPKFIGVDWGAVTTAVQSKATEIAILRKVTSKVTSTATVTLGRAIRTKYVVTFDVAAGAGVDQYVARVTDLADKRD